MKDYELAAYQRLECCINCLRHTTMTVTSTAPFYIYCMAFQKPVSPLDKCAWYISERKENEQ